VKNKDLTKEQLVEQISALQDRINSLEKTVAAQRQTEDALRTSEKNLSAILEKNADGVIIVDTDGTVLYVNPAAEKLFGKRKEDFLGYPFGFPISTDKAPDSVIIRKGDLLCEAELRVAPVQWQQRPAFQLSIRDITERKRAEEALRERMKELRCLYSIIDMLGKTDTIEETLQKTVEIMPSGLNCSEIACARITLGDQEFKTENFQETAWKLSTDMIVSGKPVGVVEVRYLGEMSDSDEGPFLKEERDLINAVAERLGRTIERNGMESQLKQAQKMESVGRLAGGVAHDYNNALSVIIGFTEMAIDGVDPTGPLRDDLDEVLKAANRATDITRQLLAFARKQTISPKVLDLNDNVESMLKMLRRLIGEDIDLVWSPGAGLWPVKMDPSQIDQIMANLCVNARDAIVGVGKVTIETENSTLDATYCADHPGFVPGEFVLLAVSDNGCGMDKEILDKIFEPFFTTKDVDKGTGLGLAMVYGIAKQNNGFVNVYSEPGQGTTIKIYLPRHGGKAVEIKRESTAQIPQGQGETVLVVEDDLSVLKLARQILEGLGYTVLTAGTTTEAIGLAEEHAGEISLLLTDVIMPEMNGRDLAQQLQALYPDLKHIFMSGYTANIIATRGVIDKGEHFIQKPFSRRDLAIIVRKVLDE